MKMADVDRLAREYNFEQLKAIGLCDRYEDVGRYIWHGGATMLAGTHMIWSMSIS